MKKLIIAAFAAAVAVCANAATVKWTTSGVYEMGSTTTKATGYLAYFVSSADYELSDAVADLASAKTSFISTYGQAEKATSSGSVLGQNITTTAGNSETWTGYLVILNASKLDAATHAYITTEVSKTTGATGQTATLAFSNLTGTQSASNWYALSPVPEPTSGLLMLLGMGVLALRRRRA